MAQYHKVLWSEGLFLTQHHFQQFDAFHEQDRWFLARSLVPFAWGATQLAVDVEGIANRQFTLTGFEGVLPDGTTIRAPLVDDLPPSRSFDSAFKPTDKVMSVYLGLPRLRGGAQGVQMGDAEVRTATRFLQGFSVVPDQVTGENEREIPCAKKRLTVLFSGEDIEGYDYLKIAEIERNPEGIPQLRETYIPPLLSVSASPWLTGQLRALLELSSANSQALIDRVRQRTRDFTEFTSVDMPDYLKLQTVNANIPSIVHMNSYPHCIHPVQMFDVLARFAGHLCVFKVGEHPRDLPIYRHDELGGVFTALIIKLRILLEFVDLRRFVRITLRRLDDSRLDGDIPDPELFATSDFYFGVEAGVPENKIVSEFPKYAKVISPDMISRLIGNAIPGANLIFTQNPPASLPRKAGKVYFRIDPRGDRWDHIKRTSQIAIYVPPQEFPSLDIECLAVQK